MNTLKTMWEKFDTNMTASFLALSAQLNKIPDSIFYLAVVFWTVSMVLLAAF